jgi:predicted nuclease of predicted toxin-antitoxin system
MRIKLDENFDVRLVPLVAADGHDVDTVRAEGLSGKPDQTIYETCRKDGRVVMTLDLDFSNPLRFPPAATEGIVVLRVPRPLLPVIRATLQSVLPMLKTQPLKGKLWIVEPGRIRVYDPTDGSE